MQALAQTSTAGTAYTDAAVLAALTASSAAESWRFDLLDGAGRYLADLTPSVVYGSAEVSHDSTLAVKRSLKLRLRGDASLGNVLRNLIRVRYRLRMPDGGFVVYPLGTFVLTPPEREIEAGKTWLAVRAPDLSQLLVPGFSAAFRLAAGTTVGSAVAQILSGYGGVAPLEVQIPDGGKTLPVELPWDAGASRLTAVNDVLEAFGYQTAWLEDFTIRSAPLPDYARSFSAYTFDTTGGRSIVLGSARDVPDPGRMFNQCRVKVEDPRRTPAVLSPLYENTDPASPISTTNWMPVIKIVSDSKIVDVDAASLRAKWEVQSAARLYSVRSMQTFAWPFYQERDIVTVLYSSTDEGGVIRQRYVAEKWSHVCRAGSPTKHELGRIFDS